MQTVQLGKTGLETSVLGYGCTGLMRPLAETDRFALLRAAMDCGIRHFDVARYYGHGGAEGVLGRFLSQNNLRDQVTVTTKFGLQPSAIGQSRRGKLIMNIGRRLGAINPQMRSVLSKLAQRNAQTCRFDVASAKSSLEMSLKELATDRIDLLLLHGAKLEDTYSSGLLDFLEGEKRAGKVLAFGVGTDFAETLRIISNAPVFARVVQVENNLGTWNLGELDASQRMILSHSVFRVLPALKSALEQSDKLSKLFSAWQQSRGLEGFTLASFLLAYSLHENPVGITLFSSLHPHRIRENALGALQLTALQEEDWVSFTSIAKEALSESRNVVGL